MMQSQWEIVIFNKKRILLFQTCHVYIAKSKLEQIVNLKGNFLQK